MPLTRAVNLGGDYLDFKELAKSAGGKCAVVFRIREFRNAEPGQHGPLLPVVVDVLICGGPRAGEVVTDERIIGALTSTLRGVRNPKNGEAIPAATTSVGDHILAIVKVLNEGKSNEASVGDSPSDADEQAAQMYYRDGAGFDQSAPAPSGQAPANGAQQPAMSGAPAGAPEGVGDTPPWM